MEKEIYKDVIGYEGFYQISNLGNIKGIERTVSDGRGSVHLIKEKHLKINESGPYKMIHLSKNGIIKIHAIHRLVASAFIINKDNKRNVNHIDGNKKNNNALNLEWVTNSENARHSLDVIMNEPPRNKTCVQISLDGFVLNVFKSQMQASRETGIHKNRISEVATGIRKNYKGYIFA